MGENRSKLGLGILIGVSIVLVIGLGGFIVYDKVLSGNNESVNGNDNKVNNLDEIENLGTDDTVANKLYSSISFPECNSYKDYYYRTDKFVASELSSGLKIYFAARNTEKFTYDDFGMVIKEEDLIKTYNQLFGKNDVYKFDVENTIGVIEKQSDGTIKFFDADACLPLIKKNITKIEKNISKDEYYVYEKVAFLEYLPELSKYSNHFNVYSDYDKTKLISEKNSENEVISKNVGNLDTYKYIFKSNGDGTYYFYSVEKIKSTSTSNEEVTLNYNIEGTMPNVKITVNGKYVDVTGSNIEVIGRLKDTLVVKVWSMDYYDYYVVDKNANIVSIFIGKGSSLSNNYTKVYLKGNFVGNLVIENDSIIIDSNNVASEPVYNSCNKNDNDIVEYKEKFTYSNGKFSSSTLVKSTTAKEYRQNNNIKCKKYDNINIE